MDYYLYGSINSDYDSLLDINLVNKPKSNKKFKKLKKYCKIFFIVFGIISLCFFLITLYIYITHTNLQSRLSYTDNNSTNLTVTWSTALNYNSNSLTLNGNERSITYQSKTSSFMSCWPFKRYIHRVFLTNLTSILPYKYTVRSGNYIESSEFTIPNKNINTTSLVVFGDMGAFDDESLYYIIKDIDNNTYDFMLHLGDIAYNLQSYFGIVGDIFLSEMQPIASKIPYMVLPGNHESYDNFSNYINRFSMPNYNINKNLYYSIDKAPIKIIAINTEVFYFKQLQPTFQSQLNYLEHELKNTNRHIYPWLIVSGHRPMYCSNDNNNDCTHWKTTPVRKYLEDLLYKYNVTIYLSAHEHSYERICPIYNGTCDGEQSEQRDIHNYINISYPIHIISGCAGNVESQDNFRQNIENRSLVRNSHRGYGILTATQNKLNWKSYSVNRKHKKEIDYFSIFR